MRNGPDVEGSGLLSLVSRVAAAAAYGRGVVMPCVLVEGDGAIGEPFGPLRELASRTSRPSASGPSSPAWPRPAPSGVERRCRAQLEDLEYKDASLGRDRGTSAFGQLEDFEYKDAH